MIKRFVEKYSKDCSQVSYEEIINDISDAVAGILLPAVPLWKDEIIFRIRNNYNNEVFNQINQFSIRKDLKNISDYGRLNKPHQAIFYGCLGYGDLEHASLIPVIETHPTLRAKKTGTKETQIFTCSYWRVTGDLKVLVMPFHSSIKNKRLLLAKKHYEERYWRDFPEADKIIQLLSFFSSKLGEEITNPADYKFTAAFGDYFINHEGLDGIIYPSIKSDYSTENIALSPGALKKINFYMADMSEMFINGPQVFIDKFAVARKLTNGRLEWKDIQRHNPEFIRSKIGWFPADR